MKTITTLFTVLFTTILFAQTEEEQKAWMEYMTPSKMHQKLANDVGEWSASTTMWMEPGGEPIQSTGTSFVSMLLDGRYQQSVYQSEFMGMPMEGLSTLAYDNMTKEFTSTWIDNFGTGMMVLKGTFNNEKNHINFTGEMVDPFSGKRLPVREIYTYLDEDTQKMEMYLTKDGKEFQTMEIIFNRVYAIEAAGIVKQDVSETVVNNASDAVMGTAEEVVGQAVYTVEDVAIPTFDSAEVQKFAIEYDAFFKEVVNASKMGDAEKIQELQSKAQEWVTKQSEMIQQISPEDQQKLADWATKLARQASNQ